VLGLQAQSSTNLTQVPNKLSPISLTNNADATTTTNSDAISYNKVDLTVSQQGTAYNHNRSFGLDVSLSIDPFASVPSLWVGVSQSVYWQPAFAASTDVDADWVFNVHGNWYVNPGWSIGEVYGANTPRLTRTGPEVEVQYYFNDNWFIAFNANYDLVTEQDGRWASSGDTVGLRESIGFGFEW
jgi:hypothetical protein